MSAISERARDFWDRISPRERRLVVIAAIATPLIVAIWLGLAIQDGLTAMEQHNDHMRTALHVLADMRAKGMTHQHVDESLKLMPSEPIDLDTYLTNAAKKAGFDLKSTITPHPKQHRNGFVTSSSSLRLEGLSIEQVKDFLTAIETDSRYVAVTHLELSRESDKTKLDADLDVSTYSKQRSSGGKGSASGSAGSAQKGG